MATQIQKIRRRTNGTINLDYYRSRALMERRAAVSKMMSGALSLASPLATAAAMVVMASHASVAKGNASAGAPFAIPAVFQPR